MFTLYPHVHIPPFYPTATVTLL